MSLKDQITEDMKTAMRAKDAARLLTIRGLLAACKQREVDERIVLDDAAVIAIVDKLVKQRKDSITQFTAGGRLDLVEKESAELAVLEGLPAAAPERRRGGHRSGHRGGRTRRHRPGRHGQGDGRSQDPPGRQGRHGPGVCRRQAGPEPVSQPAPSGHRGKP